jgi:hypothetical protein
MAELTKFHMLCGCTLAVFGFSKMTRTTALQQNHCEYAYTYACITPPIRKANIVETNGEHITYYALRVPRQRGEE